MTAAAAGRAGDASDPYVATDRERFDEALDIVTGGHGAGTLRRLAYPVYVSLLVGLVYGFTLARFAFVSSDPDWIRRHLLTAPAVAVGVVLLALTAALVWRASGQRGAVVPPIAWTDQVLVSSIDRALAVLPWWRLTLAAAVTGGGLLGALLGGCLWSSAVTGPGALPVGALGGAAIGALLAYVALYGQTGLRCPRRPTPALRLLRLDDLRTQAATGDHLVGALLAGDVRAGQLEFAPPPRGGRARTLTLRPGRPVASVARRDLLGLRRDPFSAWRGAILSLLGAGAAVWVVAEPATPRILSCLGLVLLHFGAGAWGEGLRMNADHSGSPILYGLSPARAAVAHSILPTAGALAVWLLTAPVALATLGGGTAQGSSLAYGAAVIGAGVAVALSTIGTTWMATFRPPAGAAVFAPGAGPPALLLRFAAPALLAFLVGAFLPTAVRPHDLPGDLVRPAAVLAVTLGWAWARMRTATQRKPDE